MTSKLRSSHIKGELLVRLKAQSRVLVQKEANSPFSGLGKVAARYPLGGEVSPKDQFSSSEILHVKLSDTSDAGLEQAIDQLESDPRVAYAVTNDVVHSFGEARAVVPNDLHKALYGMERISAPQAWADTSGERGEAPLIAVIDSGVDYNHPDLKDNIWTNPNEVVNGKDDDGNGVIDDIHGYSPVRKSGDPMDSGSHGTHVAGTVGAVGNNGQGVTGVAWEANMMPVQFLAGGTGTLADAIAGIAYADAMGARVTQNSWGGGAPNQALIDAFSSSSALHICAAGNDGNNSDIKPMFPAAYPLSNILSVAATDDQDNLASFSNYGQSSVDLAAPGVKTYSTIPGGEFGLKSGTSMATPHVSGAASLILTKFPNLSNEELKDRLMFSTDRVWQLEGKVASGGRLNVARALENDKVAPGQMADFGVLDADAFSVALKWKASGDDGALGQAAAYELAYSNKPFTAEDFKKQSQVTTGTPKLPGAKESVKFELVPSARERELYVAMRSVDNVGNRSEIQTLKVAVPAANVAFEDGPENWSTEGDWGREFVEGRGEVWTDSPDGFYKRDQNASLTSKPIDLRDFATAQLQFECRHDLEINFDKIFLEVNSGEKNAPWTELKKFNLLDGWHKEKFDLTEYTGNENVQVRFRLKTDGDVHKDGFQFDKLVITGEPRPE